LKLNLHRTLTLIALTLLLAAPFASAATVSVDAPRAATPETRFEVWTATLQSLLDGPDLTRDETVVVWDALRGVDAGSFSEPIDPAAKRELFDHTHALASTLSCGAYSQVVEGFGPLGKWLETAGLVFATADCNCGDGGCANGYTCKSVNCTSPPGTTHWGRCVKSKVSIGIDEPVGGAEEL